MKRLPGLLILLAVSTSLHAADARLLLADFPLAELAKEGSTFAKAVEAAQAGDAATARKQLLAATDSRETRVSLLAWNALRDLGVQPEAADAWVVRGVVVERHDGSVAVYEDGQVRWLDANGSGVGDAPSRLVRSLIASAGPAMKSTRPMPHADASAVTKDRVRLTVLTYAGFYVIDVHAPSLTEEHPVHAPVQAATEILRLAR